MVSEIEQVQGFFTNPFASGRSIGQPEGLKVSQLREAVQEMVNKAINDRIDQASKLFFSPLKYWP